MSRGQLEETDWKRINKLLPNLDYLSNTVRALKPEILSFLLHPNSNIQIASVCFKDVIESLNGATFALSEYFAHQIWYREKTCPPDELLYTSFSKYYLDDAALRLYSAGEYLADGILMMLDLDKSVLKNNGTCKQIKVGHYFMESLPKHPVTIILKELSSSDVWLKTIKYRDDWVHNQPPLVKGLGIVYSRKKRWKVSPKNDGIAMIGFGDIPELTVEELGAFIWQADIDFYKAFLKIIEYYLNILGENGFEIMRNENLSGISVNLQLNRPSWWNEKTINLKE